MGRSLTKHARSFRHSKHPIAEVTDLEAAIRQLPKLTAFWIVAISASYEVSQAQKALLLLPHTAKRSKHIIGRAQCTNIATH